MHKKKPEKNPAKSRHERTLGTWGVGSITARDRMLPNLQPACHFHSGWDVSFIAQQPVTQNTQWAGKPIQNTLPPVLQPAKKCCGHLKPTQLWHLTSILDKETSRLDRVPDSQITMSSATLCNLDKSHGQAVRFSYSDKHSLSPKVMETLRSTDSEIDDERKMSTSCVMGRGHDWGCGSPAYLTNLGEHISLFSRYLLTQTSVQQDIAMEMTRSFVPHSPRQEGCSMNKTNPEILIPKELLVLIFTLKEKESSSH